jgi:hypothetical protein
MILLIAIILFIIFLIYSIKPRSEGYTLEGLKLSWKNKASIEGNVTKWIVVLKDKSGTKIHEYENSDAGNLKDFTDVTMNIVDKKEFDDKIIGDNTLELYYNNVSSDTKLYTKTVTFTEEDFGYTIDTSKLEEADIDIDCVGKYVKVKKDNTTKGDERFACGPADDNDRHYCQKWKYEIEREKMGSGKACTREDNYVITVQWPTEDTASFKKLDFHTDPDPNTDQNVSSVPQYYKNEWDKTPDPDIDCVGKYKRVYKGYPIHGYNYYCGETETPNILSTFGKRDNCMEWKYEIQTKKSGSGNECIRKDDEVITVQWPRKEIANVKKLDFDSTFTTADNLGMRFPDPNIDQNVSIEPQYYKNIWDNTPFPVPVTYNYTYEFIINKKSTFAGPQIQYIKIDGVLITEEQTVENKSPAAGWYNIFNFDAKYASWNTDGYKVGTKMFTIKSVKKVNEIDITYTMPRYAPGWIIKENGEIKVLEEDNKGPGVKPKPVTYTYDLTKTLKIDCEGNWNSWSSCSKPCGGGTQSRNWTTTKEPLGNGAACPSPSTETRDCNTQGCKVNCKGYWNSWSACSKRCGGGTRTRTWRTTTQPQNGGAACPTTQTQSCNTQKCGRGGGSSRTPSRPPTGGGRRRGH